MGSTDATPGRGDADVARVAALIGHRTRARVLLALADGRALPAGRLAAEAGVTASTISEHLARLLDGNLLMAERHGRARYFRLLDPSVARALEALAEIAPPEPIRSLRQATSAEALRRARTCYQHLAGRLGVAVMDALLDGGLLADSDGSHRLQASGDRRSAPAGDLTYALTPTGRERFAKFGIDVEAVLRRRPPIQYCLDWSEQRHHLSGPLGNALTNRFLDLEWISRGPKPRAVILTDAGRDGLATTFGVSSDWDQTSKN